MAQGLLPAASRLISARGSSGTCGRFKSRIRFCCLRRPWCRIVESYGIPALQLLSRNH